MLVERIRKKSSERGMSLTDVERAARIGQNTIYKWDKSSPSIDKVFAVCEVIGCAIDELLKPEDTEKTA